MGHIPDDKNFEEFMNASAEEWSEPKKTPSQPEMEDEKVDRWGSPIPGEGTVNKTNRWGSEPLEPSNTDYDPQKKKSGAKWWIIAIVIVVVLCLCLCIGFFAISALGFAPSMMGSNLFEMFQ